MTVRARPRRLAPGAVVLLAGLAALVVADTPLPATLAFLAAVVWTVLVPGVVVHRALRGRPATIVEDLGWGFATGLSVMVVVAGAFTAVGLGAWQGLAPLALLGVCLAVPRWRGLLSLAPYRETIPPAAAWTGALAAVWAVAQTAWMAWAQWDLGPGPLRWAADMYWYLGYAGELKRAVPPEVVQVAGQPFHYHWFSSLWMAGLSHVSGVPGEIIVPRLWIVPLMWGIVATSMAMGLHLCRRAGVGALAALFLVMGVQVASTWWFALQGLEPIVFTSPSHLYGMVIMLAVMAPLVDLVRGRPLGRGWAYALFMAATCGGSKSSIIPTLLCGVLLTGAVQLVRRQRVRGSVAALGVTVVGLACALPLSSGGAAGSAVKIFSTAVATVPWVIENGPMQTSQFYDLVPQQLRTSAGLALLAAILLTYVVRVLWLAAAVPVLRLPDPAPWFLLGIGVSGVGALFLIAQDGMSQVYFLRGGLIAWTLLAAWGAGLLWDRASATSSARAAACVLVGAGLGVLVTAVAQHVAPQARRGQVLDLLLRSDGVLLAAALLAAVSLVVARGRRWAPGLGLFWTSCAFAGTALPAAAAAAVPLPAGPVVSVRVAAVGLALCLLVAAAVAVATPRRGWVRAVVTLGAVVATVVASVATVSRFPTWREATKAPADLTVSQGEYRAARWLEEHAGQLDVVATNVHCYHPTRMRPEGPEGSTTCDARGFWVSGFTQRRTLVDGWAYTVQAHEAHGRGNINSRNQPFHDRELWRLNEGAFHDPTREGLSGLWDRGVRWLYADTASSPVSPRLGRLADEVYRDGTATVYRLRRP